MTTKNLYVDVHILQDLPPSNINRDDNGTPKQAVYGGVNRLRVSSQAWKRATRLSFQDGADKATTGVRTRRLAAMIEDSLRERGLDDEDAQRLAASAVTAFGIKAGKKAEDLSYLLFFGRGQLAAIADALVAGAPEWAKTPGPELDKQVATIGVRQILGVGHPLDVALFGRMVADLPSLNVDAAVQVGHAISTHAAQTQFDYFTAVDDEQEKGETGAGMIGTVEFNSATLYRFATIAVPQLAANLDDHAAAVDGVTRFVDAFARSMPTGHQNSFGNRTRPSLLAVVIREDQPVNLVSAFEKPVRGDAQEGVMAGSQTALADLYVAEMQRWGDTPAAVLATYHAGPGVGERLAAAFGPSLAMADLLGQLTAALNETGEHHD